MRFAGMQSFGFTLIDLITTLSVLCVLLGIGLPSFTGQIHATRVKTATQHLLESLELTRSQAVFSNNRTTIRKQNNWEDGWEVFIDKNNDGIPNGNEKTIQKHDKLNGVRIIANNPVKNYVSFIGSGEGRNANGSNSAGAFQAGTFTVCPQGKGKGYELILARGGRVRTHEVSEQDCAAI